jgi:hypothetical protein
LEGANLIETHMEGASLDGAYLVGATLLGAYMERAALIEVHLEGAWLQEAHLKRANLLEAHLEGSALREAHLEGSRLPAAHLEGADLREAFLDPATVLRDATLSDSQHRAIRVADTHWGGVNLATISGALPLPLGDEQAATRWQPKQLRVQPGEPRPTRAKRRYHRAQQRAEQLDLYQDAVRANRQLATVLRDQGLNEDVDRFGYRAQVLQRRVARGQVLLLPVEGQPHSLWWRARRLGAYAGSLFLDLISGHGYRPSRSIVTYVVVILAFAAAYLALAPASMHLSAGGALVTSMVSFHGRGFFPGTPDVNGLFMRFVAAEALCGLLLEITLIATFTLRLFAR